MPSADRRWWRQPRRCSDTLFMHNILFLAMCPVRTGGGGDSHDAAVTRYSCTIYYFWPTTAWTVCPVRTGGGGDSHDAAVTRYSCTIYYFWFSLGFLKVVGKRLGDAVVCQLEHEDGAVVVALDRAARIAAYILEKGRSGLSSGRGSWFRWRVSAMRGAETNAMHHLFRGQLAAHVLDHVLVVYQVVQPIGRNHQPLTVTSHWALKDAQHVRSGLFHVLLVLVVGLLLRGATDAATDDG